MTLCGGRVPRTPGSDPAQLRSQAEAGGPGSGVQSPNSADGKHPGLGKPWEQRGGASLTQGAATTVTGRDAPERDPGRDSKRASQAPPRPGPPHLWGRAASAGVEGTRAASRPGLRPSPPRRQARAAHLDARGCRNRGFEGAAASQRPRSTQVRRARLRGTSRSRGPETRPSAPAPGEEPPTAGHHERQQRQHHLCQSQAAEARAENVSVLGARARKAAPPRPHTPGGWG